MMLEVQHLEQYLIHHHFYMMGFELHLLKELKDQLGEEQIPHYMVANISKISGLYRL